MQRIRTLGCGLAIDDFGSGYSSLRYLDSFPLTEIKIDRHFVTGLHTNPFRRAVVAAVIRLGNQLGASVTAEGVEADDERRVLLELGCPFAQGFAFGRPMPEAAFLRLVSDGGPGAGHDL
jgi:EAL domain-containing protein (putative c-di-GMP-specific phosphodiesterase class I)